MSKVMSSSVYSNRDIENSEGEEIVLPLVVEEILDLLHEKWIKAEELAEHYSLEELQAAYDQGREYFGDVWDKNKVILEEAIEVAIEKENEVNLVEKRGVLYFFKGPLEDRDAAERDVARLTKGDYEKYMSWADTADPYGVRVMDIKRNGQRIRLLREKYPALEIWSSEEERVEGLKESALRVEAEGDDQEFSYTIEVEYFGDRIAELPFHAGELYVVEDMGTFVRVTGSAVDWELEEVLRRLIENEDVGDKIVVVCNETGETFEGWDEVFGAVRNAAVNKKRRFDIGDRVELVSQVEGLPEGAEGKVVSLLTEEERKVVGGDYLVRMDDGYEIVVTEEEIKREGAFSKKVLSSYKEAFEKAKEQGFPIYFEEDLICNKCGEPWDAYGVRTYADMTKGQVEKFWAGRGCPFCPKR